MPNDQARLEEAVRVALEAGAMGRPGDLDVLHEPRKFYSFLIDLVGSESSREIVVLDIACTEDRYLDFFYVAGMQGNANALKMAVNKGTAYLASRYAIDPEASQSLSCAIAAGIASYLGINDFRIEPPRQRPEERTWERQPGRPRGDDAHTMLYDSIVMPDDAETQVFGVDGSVTPVMGQGEDWIPGQQTVSDVGPTTTVTQGVTPDVNPAVVPGPPPAKKSVSPVLIGVLIIVAILAVGGGIVAWRLVGSPGGHGSGGGGSTSPTNHTVDSGEVGGTANVTTATVTFDANGADEGSAPQNIECDAWTDVKLPDPGDLKRKGFKFGGWGESRNAPKVFAAGKEYYVEKDVTLYAIWNIVVEESDQFKIEDIAYSADDGGYVAMAFATNNSSTTVDLRADFSFLDEKGEVVETSSDSAWSIGPGDTTMLTKQTANKGVKSVKWTMTASTPAFGSTSVMRCLKGTITKVDDKGAEVEIKNTSDKPAWLMFCTLYGHDEENRFAQQTNEAENREQKLEPGESVTFKYDGAYWQYFTNEVYLYGFADKYGEADTGK